MQQQIKSKRPKGGFLEGGIGIEKEAQSTTISNNNTSSTTTASRSDSSKNSKTGGATSPEQNHDDDKLLPLSPSGSKVYTGTDYAKWGRYVQVGAGRYLYERTGPATDSRPTRTSTEHVHVCDSDWTSS